MATRQPSGRQPDTRQPEGRQPGIDDGSPPIAPPAAVSPVRTAAPTFQTIDFRTMCAVFNGPTKGFAGYEFSNGRKFIQPDDRDAG